MTIIKPTVGRVVLFFTKGEAEPNAAIVARVWHDHMVNLTVFDKNGLPLPTTSVWLRQEGEPEPISPYWCEWMPYQLGQAKAHGTHTLP